MINTTKEDRFLTTDSSGNSIWRIPLATTTNDLPFAEGALLVGGIGAGTAITLFTIAHAVLTGGKRRRKRDLDFDFIPGDDFERFRTNFQDIYQSDSNWCGLRLTCELAARAGAVLDDDEKMILSYFKGVVSAEDLETLDPPELYYSYAAFIGFSTGSFEKCKDAYGKCPYSARKMMRVYKKAQDVTRRRSEPPTHHNEISHK